MRLHLLNFYLIFCWPFFGFYSAFIFAPWSTVHFLVSLLLDCERFESEEYMRLLNDAVKLPLSWVSDTNRFQGCLWRKVCRRWMIGSGRVVSSVVPVVQKVQFKG